MLLCKVCRRMNGVTIKKQTRTLTLGALHFNTQLSGVVSDATSGPSGAPGASRNKQNQN